MSIQIAKDPTENKLNVFQGYGKKIGQVKISDVSEAFNWNGEEVTRFFLDVLTDCNYHSERKLIEQTLNKKS